MTRDLGVARKWCEGALRQHARLVDTYQAFLQIHREWDQRPDSWTLQERRRVSAAGDAYLVDAHLFLIATHQLVMTLDLLDEQELLALLPAEHVTHARNAMEHDDDRGWYRADYEGFGWVVGISTDDGPGNVHGLALGPVVEGLVDIEQRLPPSPLA